MTTDSTPTFPSPAELEELRFGIDLWPVDDRSQWSLYAADPAGKRHTWEHRPSGWLSQSLTVPKHLLTADGARAHLRLEHAAEVRVRAAEFEAQSVLGHLRGRKKVTP